MDLHYYAPKKVCGGDPNSICFLQGEKLDYIQCPFCRKTVRIIRL